MKSKQTRFSQSEFKTEDKFGGSLCRQRRFRRARPVSTKETMHLILKSSVAKGRFSLRHGENFMAIDRIIKRNCAKFGVKLLKYSNNFNHLHLHVKFGSRELYKRFVRATAGQIAMVVTGASKMRPLAAILGRSRFWDARPFSRIARGLRGFKIVRDYVRLNELEADGVIEKRDARLRGVEPCERLFFESERLTATPFEQTATTSVERPAGTPVFRGQLGLDL